MSNSLPGFPFIFFYSFDDRRLSSVYVRFAGEQEPVLFEHLLNGLIVRVESQHLSAHGVYLVAVLVSETVREGFELQLGWLTKGLLR